MVQETPREGWTVASAGGETLGLDLTMTPELEAAGTAREVVREVQELRKAAGLDITDRVHAAVAQQRPARQRRGPDARR